MNKWFGKIGYIKHIQTAPSVWTDEETVHEYYGDVIRNTSRWSTNQDSTNDDLTINNQISIVADPFANQNFHSMKWIEFMDAKWKITSVEPKYPRLILSVGGVWNG